MEELVERRNDGEDIAPALEDLAEAYDVKVEHLKARAEEVFGAPIETDTVRNRAHFDAVTLRQEEAGAKEKYRQQVLAAARKAAANTWYHCVPDGEPDWQICCKKFLTAQSVIDQPLTDEISRFFRNVERDFSAARGAYRKLIA